MDCCFIQERASSDVYGLTVQGQIKDIIRARENAEYDKTDTGQGGTYLVNGLPIPDLASIRSVKASMSAIVLAEDMDSSRLLVDRDWGEPSKGFSSVGWCKSTMSTWNQQWRSRKFVPWLYLTYC